MNKVRVDHGAQHGRLGQSRGTGIAKLAIPGPDLKHLLHIINHHAKLVQFMSRQPLDRTDLKILDALQQEANLSAAEVAERVGLTPTTAWRRISRLEEDGVIRRRVALLDREAVGLSVMVFAHVRLSTQGREAIAKFEQAVRKHPEILECYTTLGEMDFLLRIVTRDIKAYEAFFLDHLSRFPMVQVVRTSIALSPIKETTVLPLTKIV